MVSGSDVRRRSGARPGAWPAAPALIPAFTIGTAAGAWWQGRKQPPGILLLVSSAQAAGSQEVSFATGLTPVVEKVLPAVVNIYSARVVRSAESGPISPFFFDFFSVSLSAGAPRRFASRWRTGGR